MILLDLMMSVMSGWQFLDERQKDRELASIPVAVISGALDASAQLPTVCGYLRKPVRPNHLIALLDRLRSGAAGHGVPAGPEQAAGGIDLSAAGPLADAAEPAGIEEEPASFRAEAPLHVLLIEESDAEARSIEALLDGEGGGRFSVRRADAR